jgi:hypothetical protein
MGGARAQTSGFPRKDKQVSEIQRYEADYDGEPWPEDDGRFVLLTDHQEALAELRADMEKRVEGLKFDKPFLHGQTSYAPIFNEAIDAALTAIKEASEFSSSDINQER